jgi:hypothetical protein
MTQHRLVEALTANQNSVARCVGQTGAVILHQNDNGAISAARGEADVRASSLAGVLDQIAEDLLRWAASPW